MKSQDELRKEMILLSLQIESCQSPEIKTLLLKRARVLLASSGKSKINEAKARISRLKDNLPLVYVRNPHGLTMIEERQPGFERLLPYRLELEKGKRMTDQIQTLAAQFNLEVPKSGAKPNTKKPKHTRHDKDKRLVSRSSRKYSEHKFKTLDSLNSTADNKDVSQEMRRQFTQGKKAFIKRETEFNGARRNDKPSIDNQSWNEEGKKLASARGVKK
ncbi:MAG: hypothetical protein ACRCUJ_08255 [Phocaeicola sp.]